MKRFIDDLTIPNPSSTLTVQGYIVPILSSIVTVTNLFVVIIYVKHYKGSKNHVRKVTSILYISIATFNILSSVPIAIGYVYMFALGHATSYIPYKFCKSWMLMINYVSFPHMCSIWYVTMLSVQRYMIIKHPFVSIEKWTIRKTLIIVAFIFIFSTVTQLSGLLDIDIRPFEIYDSNNTNVTIGVTCTVYYAEWMGDYPEIADSITLSIKMVVYIIAPCILIVYCNHWLLNILREAHEFRRRSGHRSFNGDTKQSSSLRMGHHSSSEDTKQTIPMTERNPDTPTEKERKTLRREAKENRHQLFLIFTFSSVIFLVHIPYSVIIILYIYSISTEDRSFTKLFNIGIIRNLIDVTVHFTHPLLFIFSCLISHQFRKLLFELLKCTLRPSKFKSTLKKGEEQEMIMKEIQNL